MKMNWNFWSPFFIGLAVGWNGLNILNILTDTTYKAGQIDAVQGKVHYELKLQDDGTTKWEYVK